MILEDPIRRKRVIGTAEEHLCPAKAAARAAEFERQLREPHPSEVARVRREANLPVNAPCGLAALDIDVDNREAMEAAYQFLADFQSGKRDGWAFFHGEVGSGKTTLTTALVFDLVHKTGAKALAGETRPRVNWGPRASAVWLNMPTYFEDLKRSFDGGKARFDADILRRMDCLAFDEFGNEKASLFTMDGYATLINQCLEDGRALILSGNYSPGQFYQNALKAAERRGATEDDKRAEMKAAGIADRIQSRAVIVELRGNSRRWRAGN